MNVYWRRGQIIKQGPESLFLSNWVQGADLSDLNKQHCKPCEGGVLPLDGEHAKKALREIPGWEISQDKLAIVRRFKFNKFELTMSFINALAEMAEQQGHHPDFCAGYSYCEIRYTTHAIGGLSENDFICAAKINEYWTHKQ